MVVNLIVPVVLLILSCLRLFKGWLEWWPDGIVIWLIDIGLIGLLICCAKRKLGPVPRLPIALVMVPALFLTLIMCFANLYIASHRIVRIASPPGSAPDTLTEPWDAAYFSLVTITTLGYGDYVPQDQPSRRIVMGELLSGMMLLLFSVPVLASRIAMFDTPDGTKAEITVEYGPNDTWRVRESGGSVQEYKGSGVLKITVLAKPTFEEIRKG